MQNTPSFFMYAATPVLSAPLKSSSGVTQNGLKPVNSHQFAYPTMLVNYGKATTMERIAQRSSARGLKGSSPSLDGAPIGGRVTDLLGLSKKPTAGSLQFCGSETAALRVCMAKGDSTCDRENANLTSCLERVGPLRQAIEEAGDQYLDWFTQNVNDNYTKPFTHRNVDHINHLEQEGQAVGAKRFSPRDVRAAGHRSPHLNRVVRNDNERLKVNANRLKKTSGMPSPRS